MIKIKKISNLKYEVEDNPFYCDGKGGQLGDRARILDANILEVGENFIILDKNLEDGEYNYQIDEERRKDISKQHTAQHIFSALAYTKFDLNTVGFRMSEDYSTVDLDRKDIDQKTIFELEEAVNRVIAEDIKIEELIFSNEEAHKLENLRKQVKDKIKGDVRFIKISDVDICACAGFHVNRTSEIKVFKIIDHEVIKGNWTRFYFLAGDRARKDYQMKHDIIKKMTNIFSCKTEEIIDMLDKKLKDKDRIELSLRNMINKYLEIAVKNIENDYIEYENIKFIVYNEDKNISDILGKYINLEQFLLITGYDENYALMSNIINLNCQDIIKNIIKIDPEIRGGGNLKKGNIKLKRAYSREELIELIKKGIKN